MALCEHALEKIRILEMENEYPKKLNALEPV